MGGDHRSWTGPCLLAALLVSTAMGSTTSAQTDGLVEPVLQLDVEDDPTPMDPLDGRQERAYTLTVQASAPAPEPFTVQLGYADTSPYWFPTFDPNEITFTPGSDTDPQSPQQYTAQGTAIIEPVPAVPAVPAFTPHTLDLTASTDGNTFYTSAETQTQTTATADWEPKIRINEDRTAHTVPFRGGNTTLTATLHNLGNGPARLEPTTLTAPDDCTLTPHPTDAPPWILDRGEKRSIHFQADCSFAPDEATATARLHHAYAHDTERTGPEIQTEWILGHTGQGAWNIGGIALAVTGLVLLAVRTANRFGIELPFGDRFPFQR